MQLQKMWLAGVGAAVLAAAFGSGAGCGGTIFKNLTKERTGNINIQFINNTAYRASFSYGTWDAWDKSPGTVTLQQLRLEAGTSSTAASVTCRRNAAVATQDLYDRAVLTKADQATGFDADSFDTVVHFSASAIGSTTAALPTQGTAAGVEKLLGIDYSCADTLVFTFNEDPAEPGGFRIDYVVILDKRAGE